MNTKILGRELTRVLVVLAMLVMIGGFGLFVISPPAKALPTANITLTITPGAVGGSCNSSSYGFGTVAVSTTSNTSLTYFGITNTSTVTSNWSLQITNATWTGGATPWTHSDTATAGADTAGLKADRTSPWGGDDVAVPNSTSVVIYGDLSALTDFDFGLSMVLPTSSTVTDEKTNTLEVTVAAA